MAESKDRALNIEAGGPFEDRDRNSPSPAQWEHDFYAALSRHGGQYANDPADTGD